MYTFCRSLTSIDLDLFVQIRSTLRIDCLSQTKNFSSTIIGTQKYLLGTNKSFNHTLFAVKTFNTMWKDFPLLEFCLLDILFEFVSWNNPFGILCPWIYFFFLISWFQYIVHMPLMLIWFLFCQSEEHMNRLDREIREIERVGKKADRGTIYCACGVLGLVIGLILVFVYILWCINKPI